MSEENKRTTPQSELDLVMLTTNSVWGMPEVSNELKERTNKQFITKDENGEEGLTIKSMWGMLGYYTRDMRLSNLSAFNGEFEYVKYHIDLAGDCLQEGLVKPFLVALSRAATVLELSQSKGGFLRKKMGTIRQETSHEQVDPPKRQLFGGKKKES